MNKSTRPDPEEFGRQILWHLCGMRAEMRVMLHMFSRHIEPDIKKADKLYVSWIKQTLATQDKFYNEALEEVRIPKSKG
jgi:hypothetical protein